MELNKRLYDLFLPQSRNVIVETLSIGLGYTAVTTSDGGTGLSYTYFNDKKSCMVLNRDVDHEGGPAEGLLEAILSDTPIERSMGLALINALNHRTALELPDDADNTVMFERFKIDKGRRVAMVGYFGPLVRNFEQKGVLLEILDISRGLGDKESFYKKLRDWAQVLLLTSTSILNNSAEEILSHAGKDVKTAMLGPSTPMTADAFRHLPVAMLAGTVPIDQENTLKAVRHGMGTPVLHRYSRKVFLSLNE